MRRFASLAFAIFALLSVACRTMNDERWGQVATYPELAGYIGIPDWDHVVESMIDGSWFKGQHLAELPDHADAHVEFGAGE